MGKPLDLTGSRFGRLTVKEQAEHKIMPNGDKRRCWVCVCDCGSVITATTMDLRSGDVQSCGCLKSDLTVIRMTRHGDSKTHLHNVWRAMIRRCEDRNQEDYKYYGGRGIRVCALWKNQYEAFKDWALRSGYENGLTIDRKDVNGDYCPENCRWVTMSAQNNNRRSNVLYTFNGETHNIKEWSIISGIPYSTLYMRLRNGWDISQALSKDVR